MLSSAWCCLPLQREQARALVSRCRAVLESVPGKLRSCLEERDATRQRADEALQAKEEVGGCLVLSDAPGCLRCSPAARLLPRHRRTWGTLGVGTPHGEEQPKASPEGTVSLQASCQLEETSVALQDAVTQLEQLTVANSRLSTGRGG